VLDEKTVFDAGGQSFHAPGADTVLLHGSTSPHDHRSYHPHGAIAALKIDGREVTLEPGEIALGSVPEGVAY
jgi:hypothetical protein